MDAKVERNIETKKTYCRFCHAYCAMEVDVEDGKPIAVRGDASDPVYGGYTCIKGRQLVEAYDHPDRLHTPLKRMPDGSFKEITMTQAMDEIAEKVGAIIEKHGPRAIASYNGTYAFQESAALAVSRGFHQGIGSDSYYTSVTIDQPAKAISASRVGGWAGGVHSFRTADVVLIIGCNTVVSQFAPFGGVPFFNPSRMLNDAKKRGLKVIVIDPRYTEVARKADLHLQIRPGQDPTLLSGILNVILSEELYDKEFCDGHIEGLDDIKASVADYTPDYVEKRTDVPANLIVEAARMFAAGPRGRATTGTGPDMSQRGNLTEHLVQTLNAVCGRFNREGETVPNPGILTALLPGKAQVTPAAPAFGNGPKSRVRGLGQVFGEMPTAALSDEIIEPGDGQVKALFNIGGNPIVAWPDQVKTKKAIDALDLLVCVDIRLAATAKHADYVIPGKICLEREDAPTLADSWFDVPYSHYTEAVVEPNGDLVEEWEFYWELAHRLESNIPLPGGELPVDEKPSKFDVLELVCPDARVPLADIRARDGGAIFDEISIPVVAGDEDADAKLQLSPDGIVDEIREVRTETLTEDGKPAKDGDYSHLLVSRRLKQVYNSSGRDLSQSRKKGTTNSAYMNPGDIDALGIESGGMVQISGRYGAILGVAEAAPDLKSGVISMAHAWGDLPGNEGNVREIGSSTNRLLSNDQEYDPITGMARQSAIPVNVRAVAE